MKKTLALLILCSLAAMTSSHAADAKETWHKSCQKCHGANGNGDTKIGKKFGVKDYTDPKVQSAMTDEDMIKMIKNGKKEGDSTRMKAYTELSDSEVKELVAYIRTFKK